MKRLFALLLVVAIVLSLPIISFATYTLGEGTYVVPNGIKPGDYYVTNYDISSTKVSITRDGTDIMSSEIDRITIPISIQANDTVTISQGEAFFYNEEMFDGCEYVESGHYYCPDDIPSGKYTFTTLGGFNAGISVKDPNDLDEYGDPKVLDYAYLYAGDSYTLSIKEGQMFAINHPGYLKKHFKLFG